MYPFLKFGNIEVPTYNVLSVIAYVVGIFVIFLETDRKKFPIEVFLYILLGALLGGLIGSRIGSAIFVYGDYYSHNISQILIPQVGGKTLIGGLIGGYLGVVATKKILKFNRSTGDLFAPALAIGIAIGRVGCFFNGCCYGIKTNLPWGVNFKGIICHPTQIYESIFCFILFVFLWSIRKRVRREGDLFKIFLLSYMLFRFCIEFLRADVVSFMFGLSYAQFICMIAFVAIGFYFAKTNLNVSAMKKERGVL